MTAGSRLPSFRGAIDLAMGRKRCSGPSNSWPTIIVQTVLVSSRDSLATLGGIEVIRTLIVYFLNLESRQGAETAGDLAVA